MRHSCYKKSIRRGNVQTSILATVQKNIPVLLDYLHLALAERTRHVVIQEYTPNNKSNSIIDVLKLKPVLIVLSAKDVERLRERAGQLIDAIEKEKYLERDLPRIAYTLQTGREAMDARFGMSVKSVQELRQRLIDFLHGRMDRLFVGRFDESASASDRKESKSQNEIDRAFIAWIERCDESLLLNFWIQGNEIDWNRLYVNKKPKRICLPTYPFARESYWIFPKKQCGGSEQRLHPFVHENTSNLDGLRFSTKLTGEEKFLIDHKIGGKKIVPAAVFLEMARAASVLANENKEIDSPRIQLIDVVWLRPLNVEDEGTTVSIELYANDVHVLEFKISSVKNDREPIVHCNGKAGFIPSEDSFDLGRLDIPSIQSQCKHGNLNSEECYEAFRNAGIEYGRSYRRIDTIQYSKECALASLRSIGSAHNDCDEIVLDPTIVDAALQSCIGVSQNEYKNNSHISMLPFALGNLDFKGDVSQTNWIVVREETTKSNNGSEAKLRIDLCDSDGKILASLKSFIVRSLTELSRQDVSSIAVENNPCDHTIKNDFKEERDVRDFLVRTVAEIANVSPKEIDVHANFSEHGFDAVLLNEMALLLNRYNNWNLTVEQMQSYSTINKLACYLDDLKSQEGGDTDDGRINHLRALSVEYLKELLSETIKFPPHRIDENAPLEKYGIDSLMSMQMTERLEENFGPLSKTLFFEYRTIAALTEYFLGSFSNQLKTLVGSKKVSQ